MARFRIWSRVQRVADAQFICTVVALPDPPSPEIRVEAETRVHSTADAAKAACKALCATLRSRLHHRGDGVTREEHV